ncbi:hypothetical protein IAI10_23615 [Clostridium sp. 19966]|uniref:hypothetical protein n=1 Tax=Clostridium sp. 19966 TaxID=2768166 RepID=UPI0028DE466B|nr:hypothetical protein [Clostridium sp. 19966]MDT8719634.1 hypothetical protein [Clostridium sp. 19966]
MSINSIGPSTVYSNNNNITIKQPPDNSCEYAKGPIGCLHIDPATGKLTEVVAGEDTIPAANFDKSKIYVEDAIVRYDYNTGENEFVTYNSKGEMNGPSSSTDTYSGVFSLSNRGESSQQKIFDDLDTSFSAYEPVSNNIPQNRETLAEYDEESDKVQAENQKMQSQYEAVLHQYDGYSTPIADCMNTYLSGLQNQNIHSAANNLTDVPTGDGNYLAESIVAYDKAKTEIQDTYSSDNIAKRAKEQGISDIDGYTKQQQTKEKAELQNLNQYYSKATGENIDAQANSLNTFFNGAKSINDPNETSISNSLVDMEKQLFSVYSQFKQDNNIDYSNESVEDIAKKFEDYSQGKITATADISGTSFTYKDIVSAGEVLNDSFAVSNTSNTVDAYKAALGNSEVSYVAVHDMTNSAGTLLLQEYNKHIYNQESSANKDIDTEYSNEAYKQLKNLDISSANAFQNSFNNALQTYFENGYDNSYAKELQSSFTTFVKQFLR